MKSLNRARWLSLIIGLFLIIGGILNFINPLGTTVSLVSILSTVIIITGVLRVIRYFSDSIFKSGAFLISGIFEVLLGSFIAYNMDASILILTTLVGFWVLFNGVTEIAVALDLKDLQLKRWWLGIVSGIIGAVLGIMLIKDSNLSMVYITAVISSYMIILGITFLATFVDLTSLKNRY